MIPSSFIGFNGDSPLLSQELKEQLAPYLAKMRDRVVLKSFYDETHAKSVEAAHFYLAFAALSEKIQLEFFRLGENDALWHDIGENPALPICAFYGEDGRFLGPLFRGIPGGKEINSFLMAVLGASGLPSLRLEASEAARLSELKEKIHIKIMVSLACNHCSKMVERCQTIAMASDRITAEMVDVALFPEIVEAHRISRVPMTLIRDCPIMGEKSSAEIIDIILG